MLSKNLVLPSSFILEAVQLLIKQPELLLNIESLRVSYAKLRIQQAQKLNEGKLNVSTHEFTDSENIIKNTFRHNLESLDPQIAFMRPIGLLGPLLGMDQILNHLHETKVLIIGPRTEAEILWYISKGFNKDNVVGLDLFSYSEFIKTGDMHQIPFEDNSFDVVNFSWVLGYSSNQKQAVQEAYRVVKPEGLIGIGEQWDPTPIAETSKMMEKSRGYSLDGTETKSCQDLIALFDVNSIDVVFKTEPLNRHKNQVGLISVIAKALK